MSGLTVTVLSDEQHAVHSESVSSAAEGFAYRAAVPQPVAPRHKLTQVGQAEPLVEAGQGALEPGDLVNIQADHLLAAAGQPRHAGVLGCWALAGLRPRGGEGRTVRANAP